MKVLEASNIKGINDSLLSHHCLLYDSLQVLLDTYKLFVHPGVNSEGKLLLSHEREVVNQLCHFCVEFINALLIIKLQEVLEFFLHILAKGVSLFDHVLDFLFRHFLSWDSQSHLGEQLTSVVPASGGSSERNSTGYPKHHEHRLQPHFCNYFKMSLTYSIMKLFVETRRTDEDNNETTRLLEKMVEWFSDIGGDSFKTITWRDESFASEIIL